MTGTFGLVNASLGADDAILRGHRIHGEVRRKNKQTTVGLVKTFCRTRKTTTFVSSSHTRKAY